MVNILRKLKTIGTEKRTHKTCPDCKNGKRKVLSCQTCNQTGKVKRAPELVQSPFQRERESVGPEDIERFVHNRIQTVRKILHERLVYNCDPQDAWPMNPENCFQMGKCPFLEACTQTNHKKWWKPSWETLDNFEPRKPDYVDMKQMIKEEVS